MQKSADRNLVRRLNVALILNCLRTSDCRTRARLAASTGLTRATVSSLVDELIDLNLVRESGLHPSEGGRPGTCLELNPAGGFAIGIEIGVGFVSVVLTDFVANILWRDRAEFASKDFATIIGLTEQLVDHAEARSKALNSKLLGIGVGLPGLVKIDEGLLRIAPNLGWRDVPFQEMWQKRYGVPVYVVNEGTAAALGEHYFGVAAEYHDFIYVSASFVGIGAGIVVGGRLFQGIDGYAGEIGHMVLDTSGPVCACGRRGCWEKVAGSQALLKDVLDQIQTGRSSTILDHVGGNAQKLTPDIVSQAAAEGDSLARESIERMCRMFAVGVMNLINTFNPQLIVIGGALSRTIQPFLPVIEASVNQQQFRALTDDVTIQISKLGDDACVMGAVAAVLDVVFANPVQRVEVSG